MQNISSLSVLLIHFEAIYRYEGLRTAAQKTGIPLCRLSRSLNDLEQIVQKKLFYSDKNDFKPTKEGSRLYQEVDTNSMLINLSHRFCLCARASPACRASPVAVRGHGIRGASLCPRSPPLSLSGATGRPRRGCTSCSDRRSADAGISPDDGS